MTELKIDYRDCDRVIWDEELDDFQLLWMNQLQQL